MTTPAVRFLPLAVLLTAVALAACSGSPSGISGGKIQVVAAENFWGSIVSQVGGERVEVRAIVSNPNTDPHDYEPTARDARAFAAAKYVIVNGAGYDAWASKLLSPGGASGRKVLSVADLAGRKDGDNPHLWYSPSVVLSVVDRVAEDLKAIDPANAGYYDRQAAVFKNSGLQRFNDLRAKIRQRYGGVPIASTESIFEDMATDLGLDDVTPDSFQKAISEGLDLAPQDRSKAEQQVSSRQVKVLVFNSQNATPDVQSLVDRARSAGIPVVAVTETLDPPTGTFQDWQSGQLASLEQALAEATGR